MTIVIYEKDTSFVSRFLQYHTFRYKMLELDINQLRVCPDSFSIFHLYYLVSTGVI